MDASSYHPQFERNNQRRSVGVHQVNEFSAVTAQLEAHNRKIDSLNVNGTTMRLKDIFCDKCRGEQYVKDFQDSGTFYMHEEAPVNHVGIQNSRRNNPYSNTYDPRWRQHPNFSWGGQSSQNRPQGGNQYGKQPIYPTETRKKKSSLEQMMSKFISSIENRLQNQDASVKSLENQKLAKMITNRDLSTLPSNTETNPKEQVKDIALRSGKVLEQNEKEKEDKREEAADTSRGKSSNFTLAPTAESKIFIPPPFHAALKKVKLHVQFCKFLEVFKKFHINIPFADALMQMPSYAKFLKDILANKRKLEDQMTINLTENCSALVQNKIPPKKLGLGEAKPTRMSLQLSNGSIKYTRGVIEDVLAKVDKFIFPADFVVLEMEEDMEMPLILGRSFLATSKALIDVQERKLRLNVGEEKITFDFFNALKHTLRIDDCFRIYVVDLIVCYLVQDSMNDPLEVTVTTELKEGDLDEERAGKMAYFNANHPWRKPIRMRLEDLGDQRDLNPPKSSIEDPPKLELK
ncbi:uncharacterized protein [Primulina eburnea]|uniref:uncharacterized protein n=1 Tax=Primulina eburnea TaxID=1245227 RepID=UPI003C6CA55A